MAKKTSAHFVELRQNTSHLYQTFCTTWRQLVVSIKPFVKPTMIVFAILCVGFLSIMRANFNYIDDMSRARFGVTGWDNFSRHLTNFLAQLLHASTVLTDISPFPQLLALALMAIAGIMLLYILTGKRQFSAVELIIAATLTLNPYFLECISYKFDAPYMAISVLFALIPFLFLHKSTRSFVIASFLCTIGICTTYQVSLAIFPMIVVVLSAKKWANREQLGQIGKFIAISALSFIAGVVFFQIFLMTRVDSYVSSSLPAFSQIIPNTLHNFAQYYRDVFADFRLRWIILIAIVVLGFICTFVQRSQHSKVATLGVAVLTCLVLCLLCFGVYPLFEVPLFAPRAMYGFTAMITIMGVGAVNCKWQLPKTISCLAIIVLGWMFFNLSLTYGNALAYQQEYTDFRTEHVISELSSLPEVADATEPVTVHLAGQTYSTPANETAVVQYPILRRLIPTVGQGDWMWGYYKLEHYYNFKNIRIQPLATDFNQSTCKVLRSTTYLTICGTKQDLTVILK